MVSPAIYIKFLQELQVSRHIIFKWALYWGYLQAEQAIFGTLYISSRQINQDNAS